LRYGLKEMAAANLCCGPSEKYRLLMEARTGRSAINPAATKFSPYGAICKAASQSPKA